MSNPEISFRAVLAPLSPEDFFVRIWSRSPAHVVGDPGKFSSLFSWDEFNRLLNMSKLWSDRSMKIVLDGREVDPSEFCQTGQTREGTQAQLPNPRRVTELLQHGATIILDLEFFYLFFRKWCSISHKLHFRCLIILNCDPLVTIFN